MRVTAQPRRGWLGAASIVLATGLLFSCGRDAQVRQLEFQVSALSAKLDAVQTNVGNIESRLETQGRDLRVVVTQTMCKNQSARDLVEGCAHGGCDVNRVSEALKGMRTQSHVLAYFAPNELDLNSKRLVQFDEMFRGNHINSPRIIIVTLASSGIPFDRAATLGAALRERLSSLTRTTIRGAQNTGFLPPLALGCSRFNQDLANDYTRNIPKDQPIQGEPTLNQRHLKAWIFLLDC